MPLGMWAATAQTTSTAPTMGDIRRGSYSHRGWHVEGQIGPDETLPTVEESKEMPARRMSLTPWRRGSSFQTAREFEEEVAPDADITPAPNALPTSGVRESVESTKIEPINIDEVAAPSQYDNTSMPPLALAKSYPNGYVAPPKKPWTESTVIGLKGFWKWFLTPFGFLMTLYALNVVAWGGMLFLLLIGAAPKMCSPNLPRNDFKGCNDIDSPRRKWLEIDSQILNGLFCVTGFGLVPWRFRDLYFLLRWRWTSAKGPGGRKAKLIGLRRLAGIHAGWFRLPGWDTLDEQDPTAYRASIGDTSPVDENDDDERLPLPLAKSPLPPLTGVRAAPTRLWLLDFVIWANVWNTFFQCCLCGFMWGLNRYNRPSWSTGLFIALACIVAGVGGIVMFVQGKRVKRCEGVPPDGWVADTTGNEDVNPATARPGMVQTETKAEKQ